MAGVARAAGVATTEVTVRGLWVKAPEGGATPKAAGWIVDATASSASRVGKQGAQMEVNTGWLLRKLGHLAWATK